MNKLQLAEEIQINQGRDGEINIHEDGTTLEWHTTCWLWLTISLSCSGRSKHGPLTLNVIVKQEEMWQASITLLHSAHCSRV